MILLRLPTRVCLNDAGGLGQICGTVDTNGVVMKDVAIQGTWDEALYATMPDGSKRVMWKNKPFPADPSRCEATVTVNRPGWCEK